MGRIPGWQGSEVGAPAFSSPPHSGAMASFRVLQYNILAQTLARSSYFPYCERCVGAVAGGAGATGGGAPP